MDASERTRLTDRIHVLLLAAADMEQTIAAARAIEREEERDAAGQEPNVELVHALWTAMAVCYWRPCTKSWSRRGQLDPERDGPDNSTGLGELHRSLEAMRNKVYAHTETGRDARVQEAGVAAPGPVFSEAWWEFPSEWLPDVVDLAKRQRDRFRAEAVEIQRRLAE